MDTVAPFVANIQATKAMQPGQRPFNHPSCAPKPAAVRCPPLRELGLNPTAMQLVAMRLRIVAAVALDQARFADGRARQAAQRRDGVDQRQQLRDVVPVGGGHDRDQGNACASVRR